MLSSYNSNNDSLFLLGSYDFLSLSWGWVLKSFCWSCWSNARKDLIPIPSITNPVISHWQPRKYRTVPLSSRKGAHINKFANGVPSLRLDLISLNPSNSSAINCLTSSKLFHLFPGPAKLLLPTLTTLTLTLTEIGKNRRLIECSPYLSLPLGEIYSFCRLHNLFHIVWICESLFANHWVVPHEVI